MTRIHSTAAEGFAASADAYERGRPDYPPQAIAHISDLLRLRPAVRVVDLAAGTGKFTRLLVTTGAEIVAIEPIPGMREKLLALVPQAKVLDGTAEEIPLPDRSIDGMTCAQAFHWFDGPRALREIARVLKPGATLVLVWNVRDESVPWVRDLTAILGRHQTETPHYRDRHWRQSFVGSVFSPLQSTAFSHVQRGPQQMLFDRVASISFIAALDENARRNVLEQVRQLVRGRETIELPYTTEIFWTQTPQSTT